MPIERARDRLRSWLDDSIGIVVDADSDGLLTGALLSHEAAQAPTSRQLPIVGAYDMSNLWLQPDIDLRRDAGRLVFADADVRVDGARVLSNHIITVDGYPGLSAVPAGIELCNPNYDVPGLGQRSYRDKYPFSTAGWVWTLLGRPPVTASTDPLAFGLLMAQDSAAENVERYERNCLAWEARLGPGNPYAAYYEAVRRSGKLKALGWARPRIHDHAAACVRQMLGRMSSTVEVRPSGHLGVPLRAKQSPTTLAALHDVIADMAGLPDAVGLPGVGRWRPVLRASVSYFEVHERRPELVDAFSLAQTSGRTITATMAWPDGVSPSAHGTMAAQRPDTDYS